MYIIFNSGTHDDNENAAFALINSINLALGYPNNSGTGSYAVPIGHPGGVQVAVPIISPQIYNLLTPEQQALVVSDLTQDWATE